MLHRTQFVKLKTSSFEGAWTVHDTIQRYDNLWLVWVGRYSESLPSIKRTKRYPYPYQLKIKSNHTIDQIIQMLEEFL